LLPLRVREACDIEDYNEYKTIVETILKTRPSKLIGLTTELAQIQKHGKVNYIVLSPPSGQ